MALMCCANSNFGVKSRRATRRGRGLPLVEILQSTRARWWKASEHHLLLWSWSKGDIASMFCKWHILHRIRMLLFNRSLIPRSSGHIG